MKNTVDFLTDKHLLKVLALGKDATAVHISETAVIQYANNAMLAIWGKGESVMGKTLEDALPELRGQPFIDLFKRVWNEGLTISGTDTPADLIVDGKLQTFYFNFEYRAVKDDDGKVCCILHTATDVTELKLARERAQDLAEELRAANEELTAANEEIRAANEELSAANEEITAANEELTAASQEVTAASEEINAANEELIASRQQLVDMVRHLADSEANFRSMVKQAPVGMCIIRAADLFIEEVNDAYLELVGKKRAEFDGRTIWDAVPEAAATYAPVMNKVISTGEPFIAKEHEVEFIKNGIAKKVLVDFVYEPMRTNNEVLAIMVLAIDVTDKVTARRSIEDVEERIRLAVEAAEIGTFDLDLINGNMLTSKRFDEIFGFTGHVEWQKYRKVIHPEDKRIRDAAHNDARKTGKLFYEVRVIHDDESIHWVRVQGSMYYAKDSTPLRILGTLLDITQVKRLEQQKDDFISIASHELKTPITSLKASLQLLDKIKETPGSPLIPKLVDQSLKSMSKISALVDDLLNVSRTQHSQLRINKTLFTINDMLEGCCNHVRSAGKYTLTTEGDKKLKIYADEHAIDQIIVNFVNNAVKYAPDSPEIFLKVEKIDDVAKISVRDTGPGIPKDKMVHLFDRYYQAQPAGFNNSGLGLGLYISSEIVRKHGGEIGVESEVGNGSTFWITLPLAGNGD